MPKSTTRSSSAISRNLPYRTPALFALGMAIGVLLCGVWASSAPAAVKVCQFGSGPGPCANPTGLAVDSETHRLYMADRGNHRINVFNADTHDFIEAFGWGVADGASAAAQSCTTTCFAGIPGHGAGQFDVPTQIAVDDDPASPSHHDIYVVDGPKVVRLSASGQFIRSWGAGVITGGAAGKGTLTKGSTQVTAVTTSKKAFAVSQTILGAGIPAGTRIVSLGAGTMTLSKSATTSAADVVLSVVEGPGNLPTNEVQKVTFKPNVNQTQFTLRFNTPNPSPSQAETPLSVSATAAEIQAVLEAMPNLGSGNVSASGPAGGPWTVEFKGPRFEDTDVLPLSAPGGGNMRVDTEVNGGGGVEICSAVIADSCTAGLESRQDGAFLNSNLFVDVAGPDGIFKTVSAVTPEGSPGKLSLQEFEPSGAYLGKLEFNENEVSGLAIDPTGDFYLNLQKGIQKFHPDGTEYGAPYPFPRSQNSPGIVATSQLAVDSSGNLFAAARDGSKASFWVIVEYSPAGEVIRRFGYGELTREVRGLAPFHSALGDIFVTQNETGQGDVSHLSFPPPGPIVAPGTVGASSVSNAKATLMAEINPEGKATSYVFEYVDDGTYQADITAEGAGHGFDHAKLAPVPNGSAGSGTALTSVTAVAGCTNAVLEAPEGKCLTPETLYHVRLRASNSDGTSSGESQFTTKPPIQLGTSWVTEVSTDTARVHAEVNPLGIGATAHFQYVDEETYQQSGFDQAVSVPDVGAGQSPLDLGNGETSKAVSAFLFPLEAATTYRYRVVAANPFVSVEGPERSFTTEPRSGASGESCPNEALRSGISASLPDCRAYEMVSPTDKNNGDVIGFQNLNSERTELNQASLDGERITFSAGTPFAGAPGGFYSNQYLTTRTPGGWVTEGIAPPHTTGMFGSVANTNIDLEVLFKAFSPDLSSAWFLDDSTTPLAPDAQSEFINLYRRDNATASFEALTTSTPSVVREDSNVARAEMGRPEFQGYSADENHAIFTAAAALTPDAFPSSPGEAKNQLYEFSEGELHLVSVLPNGKASSDYAWAGSYGSTLNANTHGRANVRGAISADGSRIFWSTSTSGNDTNLGGQQLYVRKNPTQTQSKITAGKCTQPARACTVFIGGYFWAATPDGSKALTTTIGKDLRVFDVDAETSTTIAGGVGGVVGASEDLSRIYFVSTEALAEGAQAGKPNLYLDEEGTKTLVATVASQDVASDPFNLEKTYRINSLAPVIHAARVTPKGGHLAFQSVASLTSNDNADAVNGKASLEVYLYDADAQKLHCVSCNRSGGRPESQPLQEAFGVGDLPTAVSAAAWIPGSENALHGPHVLKDDGSRVFFNSFDALVARDTNGRQDVYQWEAPGSGSCTEESPSFSVLNGGCVSLISSGQSGENSELIDASASGDDVFFRTAASLDPYRDDGLIDIYDARVGGGYPPPPTPAPACEGEACQGPYSPPNDPTPASSSYEGAGNAVEKTAKPKKAKKKHRAHKKKAKKAQQKKAKRANHKGRAGR